MWKLIGKLLLLGAARRWAKRPTAAAETAALVLVLNERRLGRGPKRDVLLRAAHVILLPAVVIKGVRFVRYLAVGKRPRDPGGAPVLPLPGPVLDAAAAAAAAAEADDGSGAATAAAVDPLAAAAVETAAAAAGPVPSFRHLPPPLPRSVPRSQWGLLQVPEVAPEYAAWVRCLRNVLAQQGLRSLPPGLDPDGLELTRYLLYGGLLAAHKPADAARAVAASAGRVNSTVNWRAEYPFMTARELQDWDDVTWWSGPDPDGTLWLQVHLARAVGRCNRGEGRQCVQAVISQLEYGTRVLMMQPAAAAAAAARRFDRTSSTGVPDATTPTAGSVADGDGEEHEDDSGGWTAEAVRAGGSVPTSGRGNERGGGCTRRRRSREGVAGVFGGGGGGLRGSVAGRLDDRIRVVVVGSGSNVRQVLRMLPLFREFARLVQRHYPGRLRAMYLVDMPRGLRMSVGAVLNLLSNETRQKVKVCRLEDLPDCISGAIASREAAPVQRPPAAALWREAAGPNEQLQTGQADDGTVVAADGGRDAAAAVGRSGFASGLMVALLLAATAAVPWPVGPGRGRVGTSAAVQLQQLLELQMWLMRVVPALVMAAMACLTYKSLLARP